MPNSFLTYEESLVVIKKYCQLSDVDTSHDNLLTSFLEASKAISRLGTDSTITTTDENGEPVQTIITTYPAVYRPFIVAARFLKINPLRDGITEATGTDTVKFQSQEITIDGLLNLQRSLDRLLRNIPVGWLCSEFDKPLHVTGVFVV